ncbi:phage tail protein [Mesorhizobium sp. BE184]|uniref:COG4223 family protein n=1 Tax=Mesorhizobium sp. BE184 TaxID=2817714 RepID=UPI00285485EF|nr:phage tail protein [Mesorhizobium sp. BE184]MDR7033991.1 hypothetical protein [Mesorhizobium sp. BE184]
MVKTPKVRHSKSHREPVTIDLDPGQVSRVQDDPAPEVQPNPEAEAEQAANASRPADKAPEQPGVTGFEPWDGVDEAPGSESGQNVDYGLKEEPESGKGEKPADEDRLAEDERSQDHPAGDSMTNVEPKRSGMGRIGAGLIGAVIALAGAGALQFAGVLGAPGNGVSLEGVNGEISSLKSQVADLRAASANDDGTAQVSSLASALDQVKADLATLKTKVGQGGGETGLSALGGKVAEVEAAVAALRQQGNAAPVDLGPVNEKIAALDALVKSAGEAATTQEGRLAALEQSVSQLSSKVDAQASQPKVALAIAASALKAALDRGAPFAAELDTFAAILPNAPEIAPLRAFAEKGVPTRAEIATQADAAATAMVAADVPVSEDAGVFARLMTSAESLVKVRPVGAVAGEGVPETVARMEVAVAQGDYAKALAEYDTLPEAAKTAGAEFAAKLKARIEVEKQIDALVSSAMKA